MVTWNNKPLGEPPPQNWSDPKCPESWNDEIKAALERDERGYRPFACPIPWAVDSEKK
jgi:hypothetical protein